MKKVLVTGAGGIIGHHLVTELVRQGNAVIGVDRSRRTLGRARSGTPPFAENSTEINPMSWLAARSPAEAHHVNSHAFMNTRPLRPQWLLPAIRRLLIEAFLSQEKPRSCMAATQKLGA